MVHSCLVLYYSRNRLKNNRIGITTSKKIGKAVARNRARRVIKESYRLLEPHIRTGWDFVFVARTRTSHCKMTEVRRVMCGMLKSASLIDLK